MYIHIGEEMLIRASDIIAIIDKDSICSSQNTEEFLKSNHHQIVNGAKAVYKSIVITKDGIYFSPLTSATLKKRTSVNLTALEM